MTPKIISAVFKSVLPFEFDGKTYSLLPLIFIAAFSLLLFYIQRTRLGTLARAVGTDLHTAEKLGIKSDRVRTICIIISTLFAAMSQILFVADFGTINVYTGHLGLDTFAAAAILVGGASIKRPNAPLLSGSPAVPCTVCNFTDGRPESV